MLSTNQPALFAVVLYILNDFSYAAFGRTTPNAPGWMPANDSPGARPLAYVNTSMPSLKPPDPTGNGMIPIQHAMVAYMTLIARR